MKNKLFLTAVLLMVLISLGQKSVSQVSKPRVIAMTDGEIDDRSSMVRFLMYTNDIELLGIIQTSSRFQRRGWSADKWIEGQIEAYEKVYPNLKIHDAAYPTPDELRKSLYVGDEDSSHLVMNPLTGSGGTAQLIDPSVWKDTPGSDRIVEVLLEDDPRPVHIQAWGGGNTAARAFYKLKTEYPDDYERAVSKVVMYNIWYQDGAGNYIEKMHPKVTMLIDNNFSGTWNYGSQRYTYQFVKDYVHGKGPLGALYPQDYISEGDSPAFLHTAATGLRSYEDPTYGGWGGRFYNVYGNVYKDISKGTYLRWVEYANRDFEARMEYCVAQKFEDANHKPVIKAIGGLDKTVKSGEKVILEAEITDPDGQRPSANWWQYEEADSYDGIVEFSSEPMAGAASGNRDATGPVNSRISFTAPVVTTATTIHMVLQSTDRGTPGLTSFARYIITVIPSY